MARKGGRDRDRETERPPAEKQSFPQTLILKETPSNTKEMGDSASEEHLVWFDCVAEGPGKLHKEPFI